jgi:hypothetical protein
MFLAQKLADLARSPNPNGFVMGMANEFDPPFKPENAEKIKDPIQEWVAHLYYNRPEKGYERTPEGMKAKSDEWDSYCRKGEWAEEAMENALKEPESTERWLESLEEPPTAETIFGRLSPSYQKSSASEASGASPASPSPRLTKS